MDEKECCICLDNIDIENNKIVYIINDENNHCEKNNCNCNINLHSECFFEWYRKNMTCPICRQNINNENLYFNTEDDFKQLDRVKNEFNRENTIPLPSDQIINTLFNEIENIRQQNPQYLPINIDTNIINEPLNNINRNRNRNRHRNRRNAIIPESDFRDIHYLDNIILQNSENNNIQENNNPENRNNQGNRNGQIRRRSLYSYITGLFR